ncbi:MAG: hypothetical protein Kow0029_04170 [Candidatus Rifleibacteriota bacterium]
MEILLNGKPLELEGIDSESRMSELVNTVEESLKGSGSTIVEIISDGESYSPDDHEKLEELKIVEFNKIELICLTAQQMVKVAIEDGGEGIDHLEELAMEVSADLRVGKIKDAMDKYLQFIDGVEWLTTMLRNADRAFASAMAESSLEADRQELITRLAEQTDGIRSSQESEDWVGLADLLEYEFPEILQDAKHLFKKLLDSA